MILEKTIRGDLLETGYWFRPSHEHIYIVVLEDLEYSKNDGELISLNAVAYEVNTNEIDKDIDILQLKNGQEVKGFSCFGTDDVLEILIYGKYYFPKFNEEKNQWYHKMSDSEYDADYINDNNALLRATYDIAMKESGLKTY